MSTITATQEQHISTRLYLQSGPKNKPLSNDQNGNEISFIRQIKV